MRAVGMLALVVAGCGRLDFDPLRSDATGGSGGPIAAVQSAVEEPNSGPSSVVVGLAHKPSPGDLIVVTATNYISVPTGVTLGAGAAVDTGGATLALIVREQTTTCGGGIASVAIYATVADASTTGIITVTPLPAASGQELAARATEWSGVTTLDQTAHARSLNPGASPDRFDTGATGTLASSPEIAVAAALDCSGNPSIVMWTELDGFDLQFAEGNTSVHNPTAFTEKIVTSTAPVQDHFEVAYVGTAFDAAAVIATFR